MGLGGAMARLRYFVSHHRIVTSAVFGVLFLVLADPTVQSLLLGMPLVVLGEFMRTWSSGHIRKDHALATDGPYSLTRNPLYFGSFVLGLGFALMANSWPVLFGFVLLFGLIYDATIEDEEQKLLKRFGEAFAGYCSEVPRFFPRISGWRRAPFEWELVRKHREFQTWAGIAGAVVVVVLKMWWLERG
jgi:protein-S-isoprenylcysteine O-methyltransferase Ste14